MSYTPDGSILFITLGSFTKLKGGEADYAAEDGLAAKVQARDEGLLLSTRAKALQWLKSEKHARWQGVPVSKLEWNQGLVRGRDFGGDDPRALYYPALRRFEGRFFQTLGREGKVRLLNSPHHVLFLCGLYGLISPLEPIQLYSCPVANGWRVLEIWDGPLTDVLLSYIREHDIRRVFDLTVMSVRGRLIRWSDIRGELPGNVLHAAGSMSAGDYSLVAFGQLMRDTLLLVDAADLLGISSGTKLSTASQDVWLHSTRSAHGPREVAPDVADELDRKRRGIVVFLNHVEGGPSPREEMEGDRVTRLVESGDLSHPIADAMRCIMKYRNPFHHGRRTGTSREERAEARAAWEHLTQEVESNGWDIPEFLIE